jgi:hypothetical protein
VLVEDKPDILAAVKQAWGDRVTTVLVKQGKYANASFFLAPGPDVVFESVDEVAKRGFAHIVF